MIVGRVPPRAKKRLLAAMTHWTASGFTCLHHSGEPVLESDDRREAACRRCVEESEPREALRAPPRAIAITGRVARAKHSRSGVLRCPLCAPLRCRRAA